jgi:hypothetical protein
MLVCWSSGLLRRVYLQVHTNVTEGGTASIVSPSETSVSTCTSTRSYSLEDLQRHLHRSEKLTSKKTLYT